MTVASQVEQEVTPTRDDADHAFALVETICGDIGPGIPGSAQEQRRAAAIRDALATHLGSANVALEEFPVAPRAWLSSWPISATFLLVAALLNVDVASSLPEVWADREALVAELRRLSSPIRDQPAPPRCADHAANE